MSVDHSKKVRKAVLTEGAVGRTLLRLTLPMIVGMMSMVGFNVVDTFFVSRLGTHELAAISFTFPVILLVTSISIGLGIGAASAIAKAIGRGDGHGVRRLTTDSVSLSFLIVVAVAVFGLLTIDPLFTALGAGPDVLPLVREYMTIWYVGVPFVIIPMVGNSVIRATGDTKTPATIMVIAMTVNVVLDPLLIFGLGPFPEMGLGGAALATLAARASAMTASVWILVRREHMLTLERPILSEGLASWREVLHVGAPASMTQLIVPVSIGIITRLIGQAAAHVVRHDDPVVVAQLADEIAVVERPGGVAVYSHHRFSTPLVEIVEPKIIELEPVFFEWIEVPGNLFHALSSNSQQRIATRVARPSCS